MDHSMVTPAQSGYVNSSDRPRLTSMQEDAANPGVVTMVTIAQRDATAGENWKELSELFPCSSNSGGCCIIAAPSLASDVTKVAKGGHYINLLAI